MNAVKHGMTARVVLLPDENIAEFKLRMTGIVEDLRPKSGLESVLAERVAYSFVRSDRASRARQPVCASKRIRVRKRRPNGRSGRFSTFRRRCFGRRWAGRLLIRTRNNEAASAEELDEVAHRP